MRPFDYGTKARSKDWVTKAKKGQQIYFINAEYHFNSVKSMSTAQELIDANVIKRSLRKRSM